MILHMAVRKRVVRIDGADKEVFELANGFTSVTLDNQDTAAPGRLQISNPLAEVFQDLYNRGFIGANERIAIALEELPFSNPGDNDESTSLVHLDCIV